MSLAVISLSVRKISSDVDGGKFWCNRRDRLRMQVDREEKQYKSNKKFLSHRKNLPNGEN